MTPTRDYKSLLTISLGILLAAAGCGKDISPEERQADSTYTVATTAFESGDFNQARSLLREAIILDEGLGRYSQLADEHRMLAITFAGTAEFDNAITFYERAIAHAKAIGDRGAALSSTLEIASLHRYMGEERRAYSIYSEALRLAHVFDDQTGVLDIEWAMLPSVRALRKSEEENRILASLLDHAVTSGDIAAQTRVYSESGFSRQASGDHQGALENFLRALTFAEQQRDSVTAVTILRNIGFVYEAIDKANDALQTYGEALHRADLLGHRSAPVRLEILVRVGNIYLRRQLYNDAARFYRAALNAAIRRRNKVAEGLLFIQLGHCILGQQGNPAEATRSFQSGLDLFQGLGLVSGEAYGHLSVGMGKQREGQLTEAVQHFKKSVEKFEQALWVRTDDDLFLDCERATGQFSDLGPYDGLIELLLELGRYEEAFWYMERRHGYELFHALSRFEAVTTQNPLTEALRDFRHSRALRVGAEKKYRDLLEKSGESISRIVATRAVLEEYAVALDANADSVVQQTRVYEPFARIVNIGLAEVLKLLPRNTVLVEHFAARRSLYMFAATNARVAVQISAIKREAVQAQVDEFCALLERRQSSADSTLLVTGALDRRIDELTSSLYSSFLRPIEGDFVGASKILVVPQREFAKLPLHALRRSSIRGQQFLAEQYLVSYLPAALTLLYKPALSRVNQSTDGLPKGAPSIEVVGLGHAGTTDWDAEYELRDTRAFFKDARLFFGQDATLETVRKERADIMLVAAEFRYDRRFPGNSYFILSDGKAFNTTRHVSWGELTLVPSFPTLVISDFAGQGATVEPVLPFLLFGQGCASVITQSYAPARKTKKFFGELFYTGLAAGLTAPQAIKEMQSGMVKEKEYTPSYVWAPFFLWGK